MGRKARRLNLEAPELRILDVDGERTQVELAGEPPRLSGWRPVAELHHSAEGTRVELLGDRLPAGEWTEAEPRCDHCGLRRARKTTLLLEHTSGDVAQVGTGCLEDFTGASDPLAAIALERDLAAAAVAEPQQEAEPAVGQFLAAVIALVREEGFTTKADASEESPATAELAAARVGAGVEESEADLEAGAALEEWVLRELAARPDLGGYEHRLVSVFRRSERVGERDRAMVASAWSLRSRSAAREYLAAEGEMVDVEVLVESTSTLERRSRHGEVVRHQMSDEAGHRVVWFAVGRELEEGARYRLRGKVRRQDRFRGEAVTVLERCRSERLD